MKEGREEAREEKRSQRLGPGLGDIQDLGTACVAPSVSPQWLVARRDAGLPVRPMLKVSQESPDWC